MNFAKALPLLKDSKYVDQRLKHGLAPNSSGGSLRRQFLHVARKGVYPLFYRHVTGKMPKPQLRMKVVDLLSYCTDVGFEFDKLKYGPRRLFPCRLAIGVNGNIAFPVIAVGIGGGVHKFKAIMKHMEKHFDQVDFGEANARGVFDMLTNERRAHFFYESKAEYPFAQAPNALTTQQIVEKTLSELPGPSLNPFNDDFLF